MNSNRTLGGGNLFRFSGNYERKLILEFNSVRDSFVRVIRRQLNSEVSNI
jgi:hypothetical protein